MPWTLNSNFENSLVLSFSSYKIFLIMHFNAACGVGGCEWVDVDVSGCGGCEWVYKIVRWISLWCSLALFLLKVSFNDEQNS